MERLRGKKEIGRVFRDGRRFGSAGAKLFVLDNGCEYNRICFTFPRKYGNAVERNRARRLGREAYRKLRPRLKSGFDLVLLVYPPREDETFPSRKEQLAVLFTRAGLFMETKT
ncbi:MAG: ribonuclease P protein component [Treponema sp.]|nr:ribonuclease P protein component [Treponema sp.]